MRISGLKRRVDKLAPEIKEPITIVITRRIVGGKGRAKVRELVIGGRDRQLLKR
jgi:hypothetical protein